MNKYKTKGTCSREIQFEIKNDIIESVNFIGGCDGNLKGISSLVKGMKIQDAISRLEGITCGLKSTSCPDQFAIALKQYVTNN